MTHEEFNSWFTQHKAFFPEVASWLEKQTDDAQEAIGNAWRSILAQVDFDAACRASRRLYESDDQPRSFGGHPRQIKNLARAFTGTLNEWDRQEYVTDDEGRRVPVSRCAQCDDTGWVLVFLPCAMRSMGGTIRGDTDCRCPNSRRLDCCLHTGMVACTCQHPNAVRERESGRAGFDAKAMCRADAIYPGCDPRLPPLGRLKQFMADKTNREIQESFF